MLIQWFLKNFLIKTFAPLKVGKVEQQTSIYPSSKFLAFLFHLFLGGSILKPSPDIITFPSQIFPTASLKNKDTSCITTRPLSQLTNPIVMPQYHLMLKPYSGFPQLFQKVFPVESGCKKGLCPHCHWLVGTFPLEFAILRGVGVVRGSSGGWG